MMMMPFMIIMYIARALVGIATSIAEALSRLEGKYIIALAVILLLSFFLPSVLVSIFLALLIIAMASGLIPLPDNWRLPALGLSSFFLLINLSNWMSWSGAIFIALITAGVAIVLRQSMGLREQTKEKEKRRQEIGQEVNHWEAEGYDVAEFKRKWFKQA